MSALLDSATCRAAAPIDTDDAVEVGAEPAAISQIEPRAAPTVERPVSGIVVHAQERAFRVLYEANAGFVWRNLRRLGVADADVEDKLQEVFVVAHRRWREFVDLGHGPRAWLFQIVLRVASDARRHRRRHPVDPDGGIAQERQTIEAPQAAEVDRRQALDQLDRALARIDMGRRAVLVLHEIEQMTAPEIARTLEIPLNTVYSRLRVARVELEQELRQLEGRDERDEREGREGGERR